MDRHYFQAITSLISGVAAFAGCAALAAYMANTFGVPPMPAVYAVLGMAFAHGLHRVAALTARESRGEYRLARFGEIRPVAVAEALPDPLGR